MSLGENFWASEKRFASNHKTSSAHGSGHPTLQWTPGWDRVADGERHRYKSGCDREIRRCRVRLDELAMNRFGQLWDVEGIFDLIASAAVHHELPGRFCIDSPCSNDKNTVRHRCRLPCHEFSPYHTLSTLSDFERLSGFIVDRNENSSEDRQIPSSIFLRKRNSVFPKGRGYNSSRDVECLEKQRQAS